MGFTNQPLRIPNEVRLSGEIKTETTPDNKIKTVGIKMLDEVIGLKLNGRLFKIMTI
jgi:hypothetical protein